MPKTFVVGPMCMLNRVSADPPSHLSCALYAVRVCPFLANPSRQRRKKGLDEANRAVVGDMIERNAGVSLVWSTVGPIRVEPVDEGVLFRFVGPPSSATWWREGRPATLLEVEESIESGWPELESRGMPRALFDELRVKNASYLPRADPKKKRPKKEKKGPSA